LDLPNLPVGTRLEITLPTGDVEMLEQIRKRCQKHQHPGCRCELPTAHQIPKGLTVS
jgi:hypothetical protein